MDALGALIGDLAYGLLIATAIVIGTFLGGIKDPFFVVALGLVALASSRPKRIYAVAAVFAAAAFRALGAYPNYARAGLDYWGSLPRILVVAIVIFGIVAVLTRLGRRLWLSRPNA